MTWKGWRAGSRWHRCEEWTQIWWRREVGITGRVRKNWVWCWSLDTWIESAYGEQVGQMRHAEESRPIDNLSLFWWTPPDSDSDEA